MLIFFTAFVETFLTIYVAYYCNSPTQFKVIMVGSALTVSGAIGGVAVATQVSP